VHFYEPTLLTTLGAFAAGLEHDALAHLPFPVEDVADCSRVASGISDSPTAAAARYYCAERWNDRAISARLKLAADWAHRNHANVLVGEFGAIRKLDPTSRLAWIASVRRAAEQAGFGWAIWGYDDDMGFGLRPPWLMPLDSPLLQALGLG
jgi:hypothetical protein